MICDNFSEFKDHVLTHPNGKELERMPHFACPVCKKMFRQHSNMRRHHRLHTGIKFEILGMPWLEPEASRPQKLVLGETPFQCHLCERGFIQKVALQYHISSAHQGEEHDCKLCGKIFKDSERVQN